MHLRRLLAVTLVAVVLLPAAANGNRRMRHLMHAAYTWFIASLWSWLFPPKLTIGAFNVQSFGTTKADKPLLLRILSLVICRYDVLAIQEVKDSEYKAVERLLRTVNRRCPTYGAVLSPRSGSSQASQEQIAYFYRLKSVEPVDTYAPPATRMERRPFVGLFQSRKRPSFYFVTITAHLKPKAVAEEMASLYSIYGDIMRRWEGTYPIQASVIMGDLNADCGYVTRNDWSKIRLRTNSSFEWLIQDGQQTAVQTPCAYDRIIVQDRYMNAVVPRSAQVDRYDSMWSVRWALMWNQRSFLMGIREISDHFPVRVQLRTKPRQWKSSPRENLEIPATSSNAKSVIATSPSVVSLRKRKTLIASPQQQQQPEPKKHVLPKRKIPPTRSGAGRSLLGSGGRKAVESDEEWVDSEESDID